MRNSLVDQLHALPQIRDKDVIESKFALLRLNSTPTLQDMRNLRKIMRDFGVDKTMIPKFKILRELELWRRFTISKILNS